MDIIRRFSDVAPEPQTHFDTKPTLLMSWWCTMYAITIILFRVGGRYIRVEKLFIEDSIMLAAIPLLITRMGLAHAILKHGTNNTTLDGLTSEDISSRELGSQLVLASRIIYAACLWTIKLSASFFLIRLTSQFWYTTSATSNNPNSKRAFQRLLGPFLNSFLAISFVAVVVSTLTECQPFSHYWQVSPDPGVKCRASYAQLITFTSADMLSDLALVIFPMPMLIRAKLPRKNKLGLGILLSFPLFCIAFQAFRVTEVIERHSSEQLRILTASFDILVAAVTSNALVVMTFLQDRGMKKLKYKYNPEGLTTTTTRVDKKAVLQRRWGSDEDLMRDDDDASQGGRTLEGVDVGVADRNSRGVFEMETITKPDSVKAFKNIVVQTTWDVDRGHP